MIRLLRAIFQLCCPHAEADVSVKAMHGLVTTFECACCGKRWAHQTGARSAS